MYGDYILKDVLYSNVWEHLISYILFIEMEWNKFIELVQYISDETIWSIRYLAT